MTFLGHTVLLHQNTCKKNIKKSAIYTFALGFLVVFLGGLYFEMSHRVANANQWPVEDHSLRVAQRVHLSEQVCE